MGTDELRAALDRHLESLRLSGVEYWSRPAARPAPLLPSAAGPDCVDAQAPAVVKAAEPSPSLEQKRQTLTILNDSKVKECVRCAELARTRTQTVFGVGNPAAELVFIGEAPGADEDVQGEPFVGAAGKLLTRIIEACKMKREEVYICNILKCRPPGNRTPLPDEIASCIGYLHEQLAVIQPAYICCLGAVAAQALLQVASSIGKLRGRFHDYRGSVVLCTYHPAYLLRNPAAKKEVWEDMKRLMARMGRPVG